MDNSGEEIVARARSYFNNTLHVSPEQGGQHKAYYNSDSTFEMIFPDKRYGGTYTLQGDQVCLSAIRPGDDEVTVKCHGFDDTRVPGDRWVEETPVGVVHFYLESGRSC